MKRTFLALVALVALAGTARAQAPVSATSAPAMVRDAAYMQRIADAVKDGPHKGPRPGRVVPGNVYLEPFWSVGKAPLPESPQPAEPPAPNSVQAFDYQHAPDVSFAGPGQNGGAPADCHLAVGQSHVIAVINSEFWIYNKRGGMLYHTTFDSLMGLSPGYSGSFDPKVRFDPVRNRFYMVVLDVHSTQAKGMYKLAISIGPNPTQGWYVYWLQNELGGRAIDYEELGFGPRAMYITGNFIPFGSWPPPTMGFRGSTWVLDLNQLTSGSGLNYWRFDDMRGSLNEVVGTLKTPGSSSAAAPGVDAITIALGNSTQPGVVRRALFYGWQLPAGFPGQAPSNSLRWLDVAESLPVPNATQQGGPARLIANNLGSVFMGASMANGSIATALPIESNGGVSTRTYLFSVASWPNVSILHTRDFTGTASGFNFYWPNSAVNAYGEQGVVYSQSSPTQFVSSYWTMRQRDQSSYDQYGAVALGVDYQGYGSDTPADAYRWGDYAGIDPDPVGQGFWYFDSFGGFGNLFGTRVVHVPHAVFVDAANGFFPIGTRSLPWPQFWQGVDNALDDNHLVTRTGTYSVPAGYTITKRIHVIADGGVVNVVAP